MDNFGNRDWKFCIGIEWVDNRSYFGLGYSAYIANKEENIVRIDGKASFTFSSNQSNSNNTNNTIQ